MAYRSKLEERVGNILLGDGWEYEPYAKPYKVLRNYTPDFVLPPEKGGQPIWIEVKGYFRPGDTAKYKAIRACYPDITLVMCFSHPHKPVRKGAKLTMAQWAEKEGWVWTTPSGLEDGDI